MHCLAGVDWGANRKSLKNIYAAMVRPAIDYGCIPYGSAAKTLLNRIQVYKTRHLEFVAKLLGLHQLVPCKLKWEKCHYN